jgi:RNA-binding protein
MTMDPEKRRKLRSAGQALRPAVDVGRRGLEPTVVEEVAAALKREPLVKVRLHQGATDAGREGEDALAEELARAAGAEVVERRGHTVLLYKGRRGQGE